MKNMKKIASVLLAIVMVLSLSLSVFADTNPGSISISKTVNGQTYSVYKLMDVKYNDLQTAFTYTADSDWETFLNSAEIKGVYVTIDTEGHIEWVRKIICTDTTTGHVHSNACYENADPAAFAQKAKEYAAKHSIKPDASGVKAETDDTTTPYVDESVIKFTNLELGYYLVDSTLGTLCSLDTTVPHQDMIEKNGVPINEKKVIRPDGTTNETASYQIGDTVPFVSKITIYNGSQNLVYHDKMDAGLTFDPNSVKVYYTPMSANQLVDPKNYTVVSNGVTNHDKHTHKTEEEAKACALNGACTFEVVFEQSFLDSITTSSQAVEELTVYYEAVLNKDAKIVESNNNNSKITFGDNSCSVWDDAKVYTYRFDIVKVDELHNVLSGAKFELYDVDPTSDIDSTTEGVQSPSPVSLVLQSSTANDISDYDTNTYRIATAADNTTTTVIEADDVVLEGIRVNKTYWLVETEAPAGYNMLGAPVSFMLTGDEVQSGSYEVIIEAGKWTAGGLHIINDTGLMMPETGGMGTTLFYVVGGILFVGAAVILVTKKRMSTEA